METTTPTPITPAPLNAPSTGNGKKFLIVGALVLALGGGAFFLTQGGSTLKGSFVGGGANCPAIAEKDIARAKLLEPNADGKYILSVKYNDDTVLDPLSITWSSGDLPAGATIKSYTDNTAEVSGNTTCPFIFTAKVTTTDGSYANKIYYINPPAVTATGARPTTDTRRAEGGVTSAPALTTAMPAITSTSAGNVALQGATAGMIGSNAAYTKSIATDDRKGGVTTPATTASSTSSSESQVEGNKCGPVLAKTPEGATIPMGSVVLGKYYGNTDEWYPGKVTNYSEGNYTVTYDDNTCSNNFAKERIVVLGSPAAVVSVGQDVVAKTRDGKYLGGVVTASSRGVAKITYSNASEGTVSLSSGEIWIVAK